MSLNIALIVAGYLLGSLSSAIILSKIMGLPDPREQGSGNPGATNMMRIGGKKAAALTLLGDLLKGLVPVLIAAALGVDFNIQLLVALAAFLGHLYPVFFRFQGGKGIATALGVLIGLNWMVALICIATWVLIYKVSKISSVAGLSSFALAPVYIWLVTQSPEFLLFGVVIACLIFWRHRSNIQNLIAGTES